ncbi:hypothetical protein M2444_005638 [Paenibacillus sp. PastF-3]|uniref:hypothetical protein n=1 Tax=Paenibacillus sp. PastF-3 TaxID=2940626 RepID=UPI0024759FAD|nr:hypothetical protein [Paenibacillus sp. PastF-3]MDH6373795.1 hypothetical protein [Paenibacillus sp. PastF-3]
MAMYVFRDPARKVKLLARDAFKEDKGVRFYCPNPACDAHMYICGKEGSTAFYFSAKFANHSHIKQCLHYKSNNFDPNNFNETDFDFNKALLALTLQSKPQTKKLEPGKHGQGSVIPNPPRTILQIYDLCTAYDCTDTYNGIIIGTMLLYDGSAHMYRKSADVIGWRIIEAKRSKPKFYDSEKKEIYLVAPKGKQKFKFLLRFVDDQLYKAIQKEFYENKDNTIIVAGEWDSFDTQNEFSTNVLNRRQVKILP